MPRMHEFLIIISSTKFSLLSFSRHFYCIPLHTFEPKIRRRRMIRDSIAVSVILYVFWQIVENFGVEVGQMETFTGFLFSLNGAATFFSFVLFFSIAGILFCKTLAHMWSGDSMVKIVIYALLLFSADFATAVLSTNPFSFNILAGLAEKILFSLIYLSFARMRTRESQLVIKEARVESRIQPRCQNS